MPWNGYRDNETDIGDGWDAIENCSLYIKGECRRRLGFGARVDLSGAVVWSGAELGNYALVGTAGGAILSITQSTGSVASLATGLTATKRPTWASLNGRLYYANGTEVRVSDSGTSVRTVGIVAPTVDPVATTTGSGGVITAGEHLFRYRYYDSTRNRLSNPSNADALTLTAGQKAAIAYTASGDATVDKIIIEMTAIDDDTYYRAATITNSGTTYTVDISDDTLIQQISAISTGETGHAQPPAYQIITEHRQRLWLMDPSTGTIAWSRALFPESWDIINSARIVGLDGDTHTGMASYYSDLYVFGKRSMKRMVYTGDPAAAMIVGVPGNYGVFHQRCLLKIDGGMLFGWGQSGMWMIDAMQPKDVGSRIYSTLDTLCDPTATDARFIAWEPERREVMFFFPAVGETSCKLAFVLSMDTQEWVLYRYRNSFTYGMQHSAYSDRQRLTLHDSSGYAWRVGAATNDGAGNGVVTVTSGSTTTVINGTNTAVVGQIAYFPSSGLERLITVASGSQFTVSPALPSAPSTGSIVKIGSIRQRMVTDWNPLGSLAEKKRPTGYMIAVRPEGTMGSATVAFYSDFSATASVPTSYAADTLPEGVSISDGDITVNMDIGGADGIIPVPTFCDWRRVIKTEIVTDDPYDGIRFIEAALKDDSSIASERE